MIPSPPETRASLILRLPDVADVAAWDEFVSIYGPVVFRIARRLGLQAADADDLVQEVFTAVARSVSDWLDRTDRGTFRAWLSRIAKNVAVNFLTRRATRSLGADGEHAKRLLDGIAANNGPLSDDFDLEYRREVFRRAAEQVRSVVSETTWEAFRMTHIDGISVANAAEQLGMSVGNVYIARSRVMARLKELVSRFETED
ncbi:MAG: sigma-70 family RNA polymerase sigma factor [Planctomycetaceae bacterium]